MRPPKGADVNGMETRLMLRSRFSTETTMLSAFALSKAR